jgi:hypothetical protein
MPSTLKNSVTPKPVASFFQRCLLLLLFWATRESNIFAHSHRVVYHFHPFVAVGDKLSVSWYKPGSNAITVPEDERRNEIRDMWLLFTCMTNCDGKALPPCTCFITIKRPQNGGIVPCFSKGWLVHTTKRAT